jgi:hypothetical protein
MLDGKFVDWVTGPCHEGLFFFGIGWLELQADTLSCISLQLNNLPFRPEDI